MTEENNLQEEQSTTEAGLSGFIQAAGVILAVSYPVLALSTGVRAIYQLFFKAGVADYLPAILSGIAALCYLTATVGFIVKRRWAWKLSVGVLLFESLMTIVIGTMSYLAPELIGRTVWAHFGADYGYFPLVQPLLGLAWLIHPATLRVYDIDLPWRDRLPLPF